MTLTKLEIFTLVIAICFVLLLLFGFNWIS
jgi:hypothetical protein